jgi:MFS family permease
VWNAVLLGLAAVGLTLLVRVEASASSPLLQLAHLRDAALATGLAVNAAIAAAMMATMVVGPFYLARGLGLGMAQVGLTLSVGPAVAALTGVPAGRWVDRYGAPRCIAVGLLGMAAGLALLATLPTRWGVMAYVLPLAALTASYAVAQAANNTAVMGGVADVRRGVVAGLLTLARNLGFITGGAVMVAVFGALPNAVAGMRASFGLAALLMAAALAMALRHSGFARRSPVRINS